MGVSWTTEQQQVIDLRNRNILVSAAAGSGKTAVLVERIIKVITDSEHPVDIDRLLIVTFTNAAAAEMRERIGAAIEKALDENPLNEHLQRQLTLIHNAQITTIDSFCLYVIRNHFHEIDLEPNFRIGDEGELKLLKEDVLKKILEENYANKTETFIHFVEGYASGRSDNAVCEMILQLYEFSRSYPWPKEWLVSLEKGYEIESVDDLDKADWMQSVVENIHFLLQDVLSMMEEALELTLAEDGPDMYEKTVRSDMEKYQAIAEFDSFSKLAEGISNITYDRIASSRGFEGDAEKQERVKALRDNAKGVMKKLSTQYFFCSPTVYVEQLQRTKPMVAELVRLAISFADAFALEKRRKNLVDFHDLEHFALEILVDEETKTARKTAEEFRDTFAEIMIDEYQDSNNVQETILRAISTEERGVNNIFMVGDVKQSIYRFRLARPELFMEKYDTYSTSESTTQRIDLHKNFRSRNEVLDCTNDIFYRIMDRDLGNVVYDADAALYPGASYPASESFSPEVLLVDSEDDLLEDTEYTDKKQLEAKMVADKIEKLMKTQLVTDKKTGELRPVRYSDIVILLRSLNGWADQFVSVLNEKGIPAHTVSSTGYFSTIEVQTVLCMLRILDNPRQDIPLTAVLRSPIVGLNDEELALLRLVNADVSFHEAVLDLCEQLWNEDISPDNDAEQKLFAFYKQYLKLREKVSDTPIHELIEIMLKTTGYGAYVAAMPAGNRRKANLDMLIEKAIAYENTSYKGLFHFVRYIDELQKYDVDFGEADMVGENEDVVRIMSIHKSKGLEFPVVFVSGMGKSFNKQDVRSKMVLHPELGLGLDYMDGERRVKSATIAKKAIAKQIDLENLGEELRVLYVALTRAKEKLILTGNQKNAREKLEEYRADAAGRKDSVLPYLLREGAATYLDWVLPALLSYNAANQCEKYKIEVVDITEMVSEEVESQVRDIFEKEACFEKIKNADAEKVKELDILFSKEYEYETANSGKNKYSVSELKHRAMREHFEKEDEMAIPLFVESEPALYRPKFMKDMDEDEKEEVNQGALRGTAVHRVMECYQFASDTDVKQQVEDMLSNGQITEDMKQLVNLSLVEKFVSSEVGKSMKQAEKENQLYREKPFVMGFSREELDAFGFGIGETEKKVHEEDLTLIQGIIDVFWIEEDGIVLLDYKTDRVDTAEELMERYRAQLDLYAEALNRVFADRNLSVKKKLIYSFRLGEIIET